LGRFIRHSHMKQNEYSSMENLRIFRSSFLLRVRYRSFLIGALSLRKSGASD